MRSPNVVRALVALLCLVLTGQAQWATAQAPPPDVINAVVADGTYYIIADHADIWSYMLLDVPDWSSQDNVLIQLYPRLNQANQQWRVERQSDGFFRITNVNSGKVLDVPDASTDPGVPIQQYHWNGGDNQRWRFDLTRSISRPNFSRAAFFRIVNKNSQLRIDVPNGDFSSHNIIQQYTPNTGWNQCWLLVPCS
jgi:hypothetical protein